MQRSTHKTVICMLQNNVFSSTMLNNLQLYCFQKHHTSQTDVSFQDANTM